MNNHFNKLYVFMLVLFLMNTLAERPAFAENIIQQAENETAQVDLSDGNLGLEKTRAQQAAPSSNNAQLLSAPHSLQFPDFSEIKNSYDDENFLKTEAALIKAITEGSDEDRVKKSIILSEFYIAFDFYEEAFSTIQEIKFSKSDDLQDQDYITGLKALAQYQLGRYQAIIEKKSFADHALSAPFTAMGMSQLGSHNDALQHYKNIRDTSIIPAALQAEYFQNFANSAIKQGEITLARTALNSVPQRSLSVMEQNYLRFLSGQIKLVDLKKKPSANADQIRDTLVRLEKLPLPWGGEASLERIQLDVQQQTLTAEQGLNAAQNIGLQWSGGSFERKFRFTRATLTREIGNTIDAFSSYRDVIAYAPDSIYAEQAYEVLQKMMASLFSESDDTPVFQATRIFYDNIDLLAPGALGDEQIRNATAKLRALDLLSEAAELLEHQVFQRLRGIDRSIVAAELAGIYLQDRKPQEALRVIRSTRITGLSEEMRTKRRNLEATALWKSGQHGKAIARLDLAGEQSLPEDTIYLRGMIELDMGDIKSAGETLFELATTRIATRENLDKDDQEIILNAVSAYVRSADDGRLEQIQGLMNEKFADHPVTSMIKSLTIDDSPEHFLIAYRRWLAAQQQNAPGTDI